MANNPYQFTQTGAEIQALLNKVQSPDSSPTANSTNLVTSGGVKAALDQKAAKSDVDTIEGKIPSSASSSNKMATQADLTDFITRAVTDLVNYYTKSETYTKLEVNNLIGALQQFHFEIYATLPATGDGSVLYLIGPTGTGSDKYEEYVWANNTWTKIGDTTIDLSGYVTTEALNAALLNYTTTAQLTELLNAKADKDTDAVPGNLAEFDANGNPVDSGDKKGDYVKKGSWDSSLTSGLAENLIDTKGQGSEQIIARRTSCGEESISGDGSALFKKLLGKSLVWNQIFSNNLYIGNQENCSITKQGDVYVVTPSSGATSYRTMKTLSMLLNHKYYLSTIGKYIGSGDGYSSLQLYNGSAWAEFGKEYFTSSFQRLSRIVTIPSTTQTAMLNIFRSTNGADTDEAQFYGYMLIDLTLMFGAGNEPSTVAEFEALFNKPYYAYNAGQIINNNVEAYETVGFNQWDEEWENAQLILGTKTTNNGYIASKDYVPVLPKTNYYFSIIGTYSNKTIQINYFDKNKSYLSVAYLNASNGWSFTTPINCTYILFGSQVANAITTYNHDICINLSWSGYRNGEYEPYWKRSMKIDWKKLYGKLNGQGEMVQIAPNGGRSAGTVCDVADFVRKEADIKVGGVDLGTLDFTIPEGTQNYFKSSQIPDIKTISGVDVRFDIISSKYLSCGIGIFYSNFPDKNIGVTADKSKTVVVKDSSYSDASAFKTAMSGVMLNYELATPLHYTDLMMSDDGGQTFYEIPTASKVADFGTEYAAPTEEVDANGVPKSAPLRAVIAYSTDFTRQLATMNKNYQSQESMDALLSALGTAMGGTWSKTWDSTNGKWTYSFTANSQSE